MVIPGRRVIGQYIYHDSINEAITVSLEDFQKGHNPFDLINDPIMVTDAEGNIMMVNDAFAHIRGVKKEYLIGQNVKSFDPPSKICDVLNSKMAFRGISKRTGGDYYIVEILPIIQNGNLLGAIMTVKDISAIDKVDGSDIDDLNNYQDDLYIEFIGKDPSIIRLKEKVDKIAKSDLEVLITGETGTGKELIAKSVHAQSNRSEGPFVAINCSAISASLIESELFGYEDGAFTGAKKGGKKGLFEVANGGTLFLDEIGDMPVEFQPKLLRVLEEYAIRRVGSNSNRFVDIRLIAATNKRIDELSNSESFRADLYYRLSGVNLHIPPLKERQGDIPILIKYFLKKLNEEANKSVIITPSALFVMQSYPWPGNVRELKNTITSLFHLCGGNIIRKSDLPPHFLEKDNDYKDLRPKVEISSGFEIRKEILFNYLERNKSISNREYCEIAKINRVTAYRDLSRLVSAGSLSMVGAGRSVKYIREK